LHLVVALDEWIKSVKPTDSISIPSGVSYHVKEAKGILERPFVDIFDPENENDSEDQETKEEDNYDRRNDGRT
jgi:hypothetical protein